MVILSSNLLLEHLRATVLANKCTVEVSLTCLRSFSWWGNCPWQSDWVRTIRLVIWELFKSVMFLKLRFVTSHHGLPHPPTPMETPPGLQGSWGSEAIQWFRQSTHSSTYVGQPQQSAYWSLKLNDIVVSTAHCKEGALSQLGLNRGDNRGHMTAWQCFCSCFFALCREAMYCLAVQYATCNNCYYFGHASSSFSLRRAELPLLSPQPSKV